MAELQNKKGEVGYNNFGTPMKIIKYNNCEEIEVMFLDRSNYKTTITYGNFKRGTVLNPYDRTICNVGYIGEGKYRYNVKSSQFNTKMHNCWDDMIRRCYDENKRYRHETYQNCYVCDEWHNYQNFAAWYEENFYQVGTERMHLDKDILYKNNNFYSPDTCLIVPQRINMMFMTKSRTTDSDLPQGIHRVANNRFSSGYNTKSLGVYDTIEEAMYIYNKAKYEALCNVAEEYKSMIQPKLYEALYNWIPDGINNLKVKEVKNNKSA